MPRPRRNARRFLARVDAALDDFLADAEAAAAELESGHAHTLARFEHRWRAVQDRLLASLRRIEDHGVFLVKPCIEAPAVDRVRAKIRAAMAQAASEVASELARVDGTCAAMRM